jgi:hypothetical protein
VASPDAVAEFREQAERYCALVEGARAYRRREYAALLVESLAGLVWAAARLPDLEPTPGDLPDQPTHEDWSERAGAVGQILGQWTQYWTTTETVGDDEPEVTTLPLWDDLADVWRDVKQGLLALEGDAPVEDVVWEWRWGFWMHWGAHATEALRALHARLAEEGGPPRG